MLKTKDSDASGLSKEEKKSRGYNAGTISRFLLKILTQLNSLYGKGR